MLLLSLGYTLVRDELSGREIQLTTICVFTFFVNGFITASCDAHADSRYGADDVSSSLCRGGYSMGYLLQTFIYLGAILGMNYNVTALRVQVAATPWTPTTPLAYARAKQFQMFRYVYLLFLLLPLTITILDVSYCLLRIVLESASALNDFLILVLFDIVDKHFVLAAGLGAHLHGRTCHYNDIPARGRHLRSDRRNDPQPGVRWVSALVQCYCRKQRWK
jgi:hypothetical protein